MTTADYQKAIASIPQQPGIYKYFDTADNLLYVGKAKNLKKRVSSYFTKTFTSYKTHELVQRINHIEFTIVDSEQDAFLLENSLIKQFQPKYNINLKDDKTYPFIVIKKEPFPRIFLTRKKINDGSEYLGPFTSAGKVRELISFIKQYIPLRSCKLNLTETNIAKKKFKVCLEYHLGNCKAPCEALQSTQDYATGIQQIKEILKGNLNPVINEFKKEMNLYALNLEFEKAENIKKKIEHLENYQAKSVIVSKHLNNVDVFSISKEENICYVNYLMVQNGTIVQTHTVQLEIKLDETETEVLSFAVINLRETFNSFATEIIVPFEIEHAEENITITIPKAGDKKKLLDLSLKNVNYYKEEIRRKKALHIEDDKNSSQQKVLQQLKDDLHLSSLPLHIECFDNSNFQGSYPVSAMVCFKNGLPSKKDYRHFNVKTVTGINDFATMQEVVYRRYKRLLDEKQPLPQLIIIDGGKGQLSAAMESIHSLNLNGAMTLIGLAKNEEEIFFSGNSNSIKLSWNSDSLKLIRRIRDEVHRFGITFHRQKRAAGTFKNELESIKGIGEESSNQLLKAFKSVKNIQQKNEKELAEIIGVSKAKLVYKYFNNNVE
jgi:excinuclease ABC subunit C